MIKLCFAAYDLYVLLKTIIQTIPVYIHKPTHVTKYQKRISGPLLDRIDIQRNHFSDSEKQNRETLLSVVFNADILIYGMFAFTGFLSH